MAVLYVREYVGLGRDLMGQVIQTGLEPAQSNGGTDRTAIISGVLLMSLTPNTKFIRVHADAVCSIFIGTTTATTATKVNARMAANSTEYFALDAYQSYLSVIVNT